MEEKRPLIIITGPTASGKTALSIELAKQIGGEIISADSMQVYRHMDIGSAKVTKEERKEWYDAYQMALVEEQPYIWLYHQNNLWAYSKRLKEIPIEDFVWFNFESWKWKLAD